MISKKIIVIVALIMVFLTGCSADNSSDNQKDIKVEHKESSTTINTNESSTRMNTNESKETAEMKKTDKSTLADDQIRVTVGTSSFIVNLEDNETAKELREMLTDKDLTISAENYGGFEKVCQLGKTLPRKDEDITTEAGDVMLYSGNQIVFFYGTNSWAYTKLGKVEESSLEELERVLSGSETEVTLSVK
ncbi:hypothetical protein SAMN02745111_02017 [Eubacterium uniforme]|uniref:Cyclophilin-like domain-containing protein n=1 Tax=Eubacterium uniforme TaxID=39495 RepID=A0A1T4VZJ7_9FIRM|nr:cyclophilin-like fold protein [Eubacterium uniforme]SKA70377.1 hypothetical protein SAMN02745111_02017 [Eubacterium uniforme]